MTFDFDDARAQIDARITSTLEAQGAATREISDVSEDLLAPLRESAAGGKRLRALLLLASHEAHGGGHHDQAVGVAAALELFQTAALVHDDVLDGSETRRGMPALHLRIETLHAGRGWHGSPEDFGDAGGVLAGDLALMASQRALTTAVASLPPDLAVRVTTLFSDMADLVTAGQYADMRAAAQPLEFLSHQEPDIRAVMRTKTASYTAEFPLALGAALAGASADDIGTMRAIGLHLGHAFQLRDDVLGLVGSPSATGKPTGDDIREGKRTLLMLVTWQRASETQRDLLLATLGHREAPNAQIEAALDCVRANGALDWAEEEIATRATSARRTLASLDLAPHGASALDSMIDAATNREA